MKISIDIPEKIMKYAATMLNIAIDDGTKIEKIDKIVSSMNEEPLVLEFNDTSDSKMKQMMVGIAMIAIVKKIEKDYELLSSL